MDPALPSQMEPDLPERTVIEPQARRRRRRRRSQDRTPPLHSRFDVLTEALLIFLVIFTPWAFGTTQLWAIFATNLACYSLGLLLVGKWMIRRILPYYPPRWDSDVVVAVQSGIAQSQPRTPDPGTRILAGVTLLFLGYVLVSALNARAAYADTTQSFVYLREPWRWLPFSYNRGATWFAFAQYLALACVFWSVRDWLLHRSPSDMKEDEAPAWANHGTPIIIPARLRRLLWVIALNAVLLAVVSILQRGAGTDKLLWLARTARGNRPELIFGPWAYRGNAATYFNLIWPVCLAFWIWSQERAGRLMVHRRMGRFDGPQLILLPCVVFAGVCPMISGSRGGAVISVVGALTAAALVLLISRREVSRAARWLTTGGILVAGVAAFVGGWSTIRERLSRPDTRFPTHIDAGTNDFSLLIRMRVPEGIDGHWHGLVGLGQSARNNNEPRAVQVVMGGPNNVFMVQFLGAARTNSIRFVTTNLLSENLDREVTLAVVRREGVELYLNGSRVDANIVKQGNAPGWNTEVHTRHFFVFDSHISEVALVDFGLTADEVKEASSGPLQGLEERLLTRGQSEASEPQVTPSTLTPGTTIETIERSSTPGMSWLSLQRTTAETGAVGFSTKINTPDTALHGPVRVRFRAWNPGNSPIVIGASIDGGPRGLIELQPRAEQVVAIPCRAPHGAPPQEVAVALVDQDGELREDLTAGTHLVLREFRVQPGGQIVTRKLAQQFRIFELSDRMSGRNEIYENALKMLRDYSLWGSGAGSFVSLYQLYMTPGQDWAAYLHNDWLESRITLGIVGFSLLVVGLVTLFLRSWLGSGLSTLRIVIALWWLALAGCLVHARFDFPFQIYSVVFLFVLLCAILMALTGRRQS